MASHSHPFTAGQNSQQWGGGGGGNPFWGQPYNMSPVTLNNKGGGGSHSHNLSANFVGSATSVLQPYLTLMYVIKT